MKKQTSLALPEPIAPLTRFGEVKPNALVLRPGLAFEEWEHVGQQLSFLGDAVQWWWGDWWCYGEHGYGELAAQGVSEDDYNKMRHWAWVAQKVKLGTRVPSLSWAHHRLVAAMPEEKQCHWLAQAAEHEWTYSQLAAAISASGKTLPAGEVKPHTYRCIVIDPPWPMRKIERLVRPAQGAELDYKSLDIEQIAALPVKDWVHPDGCHLYLWATHRFLPEALRIFQDAWDGEYQCLLTWVKNVGMTPYSWMYSTEHVLFGRIGGEPGFLKRGERLDFHAKVRQHSRKPDEFYDLVRRVSPEPRLDAFSREQHDGFDQWGDQIGHFACGA